MQGGSADSPTERPTVAARRRVTPSVHPRASMATSRAAATAAASYGAPCGETSQPTLDSRTPCAYGRSEEREVAMTSLMQRLRNLRARWSEVRARKHERAARKAHARHGDDPNPGMARRHGESFRGGDAPWGGGG